MAIIKRQIGDMVRAKNDSHGVFSCIITDFTNVAGEYYVKPIGKGYEMVISEEQILD